MNRARALAVVLLAIAMLTACGKDPEPTRALPVKSFSLQAHSQRLFEAYRQQTGEVKKVTTVRLHTTKFVVQVDCVGSHGKINIKVGTTGSVGRCSTRARVGESHILWDMDAKLPSHVTVVVTTDPRNTWSVAVDAGTHGRQ